MWCQSILLTLWLLKSPLTHFWLLGSLPSHVWFSGNPCCAVYTCSCPVWANWACLTSWPPQPSLGQSASLSCTGASGCPVGGVRDIELCWRALLLCNLYKHMSALMCMCLTLFLASSQLLLVLSLPCLSPSCLSVASCVCTSTSFSCDTHLCSPLLSSSDTSQEGPSVWLTFCSAALLE